MIQHKNKKSIKIEEKSGNINNLNRTNENKNGAIL
jgi:hypothetical protein